MLLHILLYKFTKSSVPKVLTVMLYCINFSIISSIKICFMCINAKLLL